MIVHAQIDSVDLSLLLLISVKKCAFSTGVATSHQEWSETALLHHLVLKKSSALRHETKYHNDQPLTWGTQVRFPVPSC